jgi:hypothetical protein
MSSSSSSYRYITRILGQREANSWDSNLSGLATFSKVNNGGKAWNDFNQNGHLEKMEIRHFKVVIWALGFCLFLCHTRDWTQGFQDVRQVLYDLSYSHKAPFQKYSFLFLFVRQSLATHVWAGLRQVIFLPLPLE